MQDNTKTLSWKEEMQLHWRAFRDMQKYCPGVATTVALHAACVALSPYVTIYLGAQLLNELAGLHRAEILWPLVWITLGATAATQLLTGLLEQQKITMENRFNLRKDRVFTDKLLSMDFADVDDPQMHDLLSQIKQDDQWSGWGFQRIFDLFEKGAQGLFGVLGAVALTVSLFTTAIPETAGALTIFNHPIFRVVFILILLLAALLGPLCPTKGEYYWTKCSEDAKFGNRIFSAFGFLGSEIKNALDIRIYQQEKVAKHYFDNCNNAFMPNGPLARCARGSMGLWVTAGEAIRVLLTGIVYVFVCLKACAGAFGVGSVTQYVGAVTTLTQNLSLLMKTVGNVRNNAPFLQTVYTFLDMPNQMYQGSLTTEKRSDRQYEVECRDVSFRYPGSDTWALRHVSMKFKVGQRLAVVGENGSGKTTFIKLLCRLYDPQEGQILLNGIDIRKYDYRDYMNIFSVVFQDFQLLSQPLGANVAGSMEYDRKRATQALVDAGFGDRLATMPSGLDTLLYKDYGENGVEISGGEAQKIAIARALYKNAPFMILDEPTAALDPIAEAEIYAKFNEISGDRTAIYISHRLSSCKFCDEIAVFHHGQVVQKGTHEKLLADLHGKYYELWNAQAQYYTEHSEDTDADLVLE